MPSYSLPQVTSSVTRNLNQWYLLSDQRQGNIYYNVVVKTSSTLALGNIGRIIVDIADNDQGLNLTSMSSGESGLDSGLLIPGSSGTVTVFGNVPVGKYFRLRTTNVTGTTTTYSSFNPNTGTSTPNTAFGMEILFG